MLIGEFEQRTGFYPTAALYRKIEERYNASNQMDKDEFCRRYKENIDGMAESIRYAANMEEMREEKRKRKEIEEKEIEIEKLKKEIAHLKENIERLEGWEPYECSNMTEERYQELKRCTKNNMDIYGAAEWIEEEFGFRKRDIVVCTEIENHQKNKEGVIRRNGTRERGPVYSATDWNYVRFDVKNWSYEVVNGMLYQYCE